MHFFKQDSKTNNKQICCHNEVLGSLMLHLLPKSILVFFFPSQFKSFFFLFPAALKIIFISKCNQSMISSTADKQLFAASPPVSY